MEKSKKEETKKIPSTDFSIFSPFQKKTLGVILTKLRNPFKWLSSASAALSDYIGRNCF